MAITILSALLLLFIVLFVLNLSSGEKQVRHRIPHQYGARDAQFMRSMGGLLAPTILEGNKIDPLKNGQNIFPAMLEAIRGARHTITFETYIYWSGDIAHEFSKALAERAKAGVRTHVMLDGWVSKKVDEEYIEIMKRAGVQLKRYHPIRWYNLSKMNNRTHRKLMIVDGKIGFTGGVGIADHWQGNAKDKEHWRDTHFRVEGPVVAQMQSVFMSNWLKTHEELLHDEHYFPALESPGNLPAQIFRSSPKEGSESVRLMYLLSMAAAQKTIYLMNAYFVPDSLSIQTFLAARSRGVKVKIIVPGKYIDEKIVRRASRVLWGKLLKAGVEIYEYQLSMYHCKVLIVDDFFVSVGSTNFDNRSFRLNDESNLNIFDSEFAQTQIEDFESDQASSKKVTLDAWQARPLKEKAIEHLAALLRTQL